jgi:hypothetical protein
VLLARIRQSSVMEKCMRDLGHCRSIASRRRTTMAMRELPFRTAAAFGKEARRAIRVVHPLCRRNASSEAVGEVESSSSFEVPPPSEELVKGYDAVARSRLRRRGNKELPPSRCASPVMASMQQAAGS